MSNRRRNRTVLTALLAVALVTAACANASRTREDPFEAVASEGDVLVTVQNRDTRNATVYAYWDGMKDRVGTVIAMQSETFRMRWRNERVQLGIEFLGSLEGYRTEYIDVTQGDHLDHVILARR